MLKDEYKVYEEKMKKSIESVANDFAAVRAGRANASVLNRIHVDYYGTPTPIQQIASVGSPDPRTLLITPWDASALKAIEKAILESDLGINPQNDGKAIRLSFPQLTEERRKDLVKQIRKYTEGGKVAIRNIRREAMENFKKQQKASEITGRAEDGGKGPAEADRRQLQGTGQAPGKQGKGAPVRLMGLFSKKIHHHEAGQVDKSRLPRHIAIIMDGNGRWAKQRGLPRTAGHKVGAETFRKIATYCKDLGVEYLTVYAFSTENWKRPADEVSTIMALLKQYMLEAIDSMERDQIRLRFLGDLSAISPELQALVDRTNEISTHIHGFQANVCLNYGGREEILHAARRFARDCADGTADPDSLTEAGFSDYLYSAGIPDPELIIRTSGEERLSGFLLWQCAYSEFYFCDTLWPDFDARALDKAIIAYQSRDRRFGGVK